MMSESVLFSAVLVVVALIVGPGSYFLLAGLRRIPPSLYAEMEETIGDMNRQMAEMRREWQAERAAAQAERAADHAEMRKLQVRVTDLEIGIKVLSAQVVRLGGEPEFTLVTPISMPVAVAVPQDDARLSQRLAATFNRDELDDLAFQLDINSEELSGERVSTRARSLVGYARRHGLVEELVLIARQLRPEGDL